MKKIFESEFNGFDDGESVTKVRIYELEDVDQYWELDGMNFEDKCDFLGVRNTYNVAPGAKCYEYDFDVSRHHVVVYETAALNI